MNTLRAAQRAYDHASANEDEIPQTFVDQAIQELWDVIEDRAAVRYLEWQRQQDNARDGV